MRCTPTGMTHTRNVLLRLREPKTGRQVVCAKWKGRGGEREHVREWAESAKRFSIEEEVQSPRRGRDTRPARKSRDAASEPRSPGK